MSFPGMLLIVAALSSAAQQPSFDDSSASRWVVSKRLDSIELYAEFEPDVPAIAAAADSVRQELQTLLETPAGNDLVQVMLFRSQASYLSYLTNRIPQARNRRAIYYRNGDVHQVFVWNSRSLITDLRHELTHATLHQQLPFIPLWLDEGLAELIEEPIELRDRSRRSITARWKARTGWQPSLISLERLPSAESMDADDYRDSWAWTCFLVNHSDASRELLSRYLADIHRGEAPGPFSKFAAAESPGLLDEANSYFRKISIRVASGSTP